MRKQNSFIMRILIKTVLFFTLNFLLSSCHFNTEISYRLYKSIEYIKEDGYIISCEKEDNNLIVGTYTPESWNNSFYYDYLKGVKSEKKIKVKDIKLKFLETNDTLILSEIRNNREYIYSSPSLTTILDNNKHLKITIFFKEGNSDTIKQKEFELTRFKHIYLTGTFPHS
jgi:hypothetical protein